MTSTKTQPSLTEVREKIALALAARAFGSKLREGKPVSFRPQIGSGVK